MLTEKIQAVEEIHGDLFPGSINIQVHVQWAKRGLPRDNYYLNTTGGTAIKSGNRWIVKGLFLHDINKFDLEVDLDKKIIDIRVKLKTGDHREWKLALVDDQKRWEVLHDNQQLFIEWKINAEMGEAFNIMKGSYVVAKV